ncbi:MAG TPA: ABC transporter permease [Candidatus Sulfotelmatobacter sp.]|nr:ABC transporter permease [Candidatus Sulfotelmatobacter sp.]
MPIRVASFFQNLLRKRAAEQALDDELQSAVELLTQEKMKEGLSHQEARRQALIELGGVEQVKEQVRDSRTGAFLDSLLQDLRFALRQMQRSPGFVLTAVLILALGIAANVIVFGVLQALVLRSLDLPHAEQVMTLQPKDAGPFVSNPEVRDVRDGNSVFSAVAVYEFQGFGLEANGVTRPVWGAEVSGQYFEVVGIKPVLGRLLERADNDHPGASEAAVISWSAWQSDFGADPNIVGTTVRIDKHPYTIVGVAPEGFRGTEKIPQLDIFVPIANEASLDGFSWLESRSYRNLFSIVRIKDGVTTPEAQAELNAIATRIAMQHPKDEEGLALKLARPGMIGDFVGGPVRAFLAGVMGLAGIVLLAACANLGSLFAARTADRAKEIAIRMALGSGRWRILRQLLVEASVISILGGALACGLAWMALTGLASWHPPTQYPLRLSFVLPQPSLILVGLLISVAAGVVFGLMPLRQIFKTDPNDTIKSGGGPFAAGRRWALRDVLLAAQIALCCVTVTAAFVSLRGLGRAMTMDLGFNPKNVLLTQFDLSQAAYSGEAADHFQRQLLDKLSQIPGVDAAGYASTTPLSGETFVSAVFSQQSSDFRPSNKAFYAYNYDISPGYLTAAGTSLLAGRDVSFADTAKTPPVAIVNQEFARRLFHSEHAVGRYFKDRDGMSIQIVGIVADGKQFTLAEDPKAAAFFPISQKASTSTTVVVRTRRDTADMVAALRGVILDLDRGVPIRELGPWNTALALSFFPSQAATVALGVFGAFGLLLSITGTFGLACYTVGKRRRELSIRVALGAQTKQILSAALGRMLILLASGSAVGILLGVAASRILSAIVYQASAQDPFVLAAVVFTLLLTGSMSVAGPVRRVLYLDPANLLREQ